MSTDGLSEQRSGLEFEGRQAYKASRSKLLCAESTKAQFFGKESAQT